MVASRERVVLLPIVGGVVVAVIVLGTIMFRSSFQLEQLRERSVVEATLLLANEKADRVDKRIIEQDNTVATLTDGDSWEEFGSRWLQVAATQTPTVRAVFVLDISDPSREVRAYASRSPGAEDERFRRLFVQRLWPELQLGEPNREELRHLHTDLDGVSYLLSHWERTRGNRRLLFVLWHDVPRVVHDLFPPLFAEEDQASRANVVDAKGRIVFGPPLSRGSFTLGRPFATTLYKWRVNVSMTAAEELAEEVERRRILEMGLVALSILVVLSGILVIVLAALRERKLSMLKSDFVANVSHELKTPLALVRMFSEMLLSGRAPAEKQKKYLEIIVQESERLTALIDNVLDFARVDRGQSSYTFVSADLRDTVTRAVEVCRGRAERQGVQIFLSLPSSPCVTELDERAIEIALINLIDNALKYAPESPSVRVGLERQGAYYWLSVSDRGAGIAPEERRRIFDRFVRGKQRAGDAIRGSGIGLSLVGQIAQAHGGRAWVEEGDGTRERPGARFVCSLRVRENVSDK